MVIYPDLSLQDYEIVERLSTNHVGGRMTYLGIRKKTQQQVVIKQFEFARPGSDWQGYNQMQREIAFLQTINHPHVCKYLTTLEVETGLCLITEYIKGTPLDLQSVTCEHAVQIASDILDILVYLQSLYPAIIHRDIKPGNIIIDELGKAHLIDFGLASIINTQDISVSATYSGTLGYMPWEQFLKRQVDFTTDVYALGAVLFTMLYPGNVSLPDLIDSRNTIPVNILGDRISLRLTDWLRTVLNTESKHRFADARAAKAELLKITTNTSQIKLEKQDVELKAETYETEEKQPEISMNWENAGKVVADREHDLAIESKFIKAHTALWVLAGAFPTIFSGALNYKLLGEIIKNIKVDLYVFADGNLQAIPNMIFYVIQFQLLLFILFQLVKSISYSREAAKELGYLEFDEVIKISLPLILFTLILIAIKMIIQIIL